MSDQDPTFEDHFAHQLRTYAAAGTPDVDRMAVARAVAAGVTAHRVRRPWRRLRLSGLGRPALAFAALVGALVLAVVVGIALWGPRSNQVVAPGPTQSSSPSPASPSPSTGPGRSTGLPNGTVWPTDLREEANGEPVIVGPTATDPRGDDGGRGVTYADIVDVREGSTAGSVEFGLAGALPIPVPDPTDQRIAYGWVVDLDGDGVADVRTGMENAAGFGNQLRWTIWANDLRGGEARSCRCDSIALGDLSFEMTYPGPWRGPIGTLGLRGAGTRDARYYIWAAMGQGNSVSATDFAPDKGWLEFHPNRPGPLRPEPPSGAPSTTLVGDPVGDATPTGNSLSDITAVSDRVGCWRSMSTEACIFFSVAGTASRPPPDPAEQWQGYGVVVDTDGDGVGDAEYGMDNVAGGGIQMWHTDLSTGVTKASPVGQLEDDVMDAVYPGDESQSDAQIFIERDATKPFRYYVWASSIDAQGNVSTDFAPDVGWLELEVGQ